MVLGLGGKGLPERRLPTAKGLHLQADGAVAGAVLVGVSSSSRPGGSGRSVGLAEVQPGGAPPGMTLPPVPPDQLLGPILQASLAHQQQQQQQHGQHQAGPYPTLSGSSTAVYPVAAGGGAAEPLSAEALDYATVPASGAAPSPTTAAAGSGEEASGQLLPLNRQQLALQALPQQGRSGRQAAIKRKLRAAEQQVVASRGASQLTGTPQRGPSAATGPVQGDAWAQQAQQLSQDQGEQAPLGPAWGQGAGETGLSELLAIPPATALPAAAGDAEAPAPQQLQVPPARGRGRGRSAAAAKQEDGDGGAATPGGSRRSKGKKRRRAAGATPSKYADLIGKMVEVPASLFKVDVPGLFYRGRVTKHEGGRKQDAMEVKFFDDGSKYWFPVADVRQWLTAMEERGGTKDTEAGIASGRATDEFAAEVLTDIASGRSMRSVLGASQLSDAAVGAPSAHAGPVQQVPAAVAGAATVAAEGPPAAAGPLTGPREPIEEGEAVSSKRLKASAAAKDPGGEAGNACGGGGGLAALHAMADTAEGWRGGFG